MARAARVLDGAELAAEPVTETITYVPGPLDPVTVKWCGHVFQANVGKEIVGHAEGTEREKLNHQLITSARDNKHFMVGDAKPKRDRDTLPKTASEYRAYAVAWLKDPNIEHADQLIARFAKDRDLRTACEVGSDDYAWIATLFMPKLHELARADELTEPQVATMWINHGINELPWSA
jgi:hypothetical protein